MNAIVGLHTVEKILAPLGGEEVDEQGGKSGLTADSSHYCIEINLQEDVVVRNRELPCEGRPIVGPPASNS